MTQRKQAALKGWRGELGRWRAAQLGLTMNKGCWLVTPAGNAVAHGYEQLYDKHRAAIWAAMNGDERT